jgi:hypothetical protein
MKVVKGTEGKAQIGTAPPGGLWKCHHLCLHRQEVLEQKLESA